MKKNLLILMMALFSAGVLSAQTGSVGIYGFCGGANSDNNTTVILGQAFAFQETNGGFEVATGAAEAQLDKGAYEIVTLTPDQDYVIPGWGTLTAPVTPGNYNIYHLYTNRYNYDSAWVYEIRMLDCDGTVEDADGNEYEVVGVAGYCWTKSNLKALHYADDGSDIPVALVYNIAPDNDEDANLEAFGRLYTWYSAVKLPEGSSDALAAGYVQGICPDGWHIPTHEEMMKLKEKPAKELKETGTDYWLGPNDNDNATGFSARGAGKAIIGGNPAFMTLRGWTDFWSVDRNTSGEGEVLEMSHFCAEPSVENRNSNLGLSVRCVRTESDGE